MCTDESERLCKRGLGFTYCKKLKTSIFTQSQHVFCRGGDWHVKIKSLLSYSVQIGLNFHLVCDIEKWYRDFHHGHCYLCYRYLCRDRHDWINIHITIAIIIAISNIIVIIEILIIRPKFCCHWSYFVNEDMLHGWSHCITSSIENQPVFKWPKTLLQLSKLIWKLDLITISGASWAKVASYSASGRLSLFSLCFSFQAGGRGAARGVSAHLRIEQMSFLGDC